jgi:hypothetical protein
VERAEITKYVYNDEGRQFVAVYCTKHGIRCSVCARSEAEKIIGVVVDYSQQEQCQKCGGIIAEVRA